MKISEPFGKNGFCGPTVLSILSGKSTDECALLISENGKPLKGMYINQMSESLRKLGIKYKWEKCFDPKYYNKFNHRHPYPTLKAWMEDCRKPSEMEEIFILTITGHFILVKGNMVTCSLTNKEWVPIENYCRKMTHVNNYFKILGDSFTING